MEADKSVVQGRMLVNSQTSATLPRAPLSVRMVRVEKRLLSMAHPLVIPRDAGF